MGCQSENYCPWLFHYLTVVLKIKKLERNKPGDWDEEANEVEE